MAEQRSTDEPFIRIVRGSPTPEEIAALVAVLLAHDSEDAQRSPVQRHRSPWANPAHLLRRLRYHRPSLFTP
ncbi:MAG TPA: acyl-CoA carboxylase subunit epsilon [Streptosporangiaceae bacterium]